MDPKTRARLVAGRGIEGNAKQGGKRQVTVISAEGWKRVSEELGRPADPSWRRANLLASGVDPRESRGKVLRVGPVKISVCGETRPCERMDEACQGLRTGAGGRMAGVVVHGVGTHDRTRSARREPLSRLQRKDSRRADQDAGDFGGDRDRMRS